MNIIDIIVIVLIIIGFVWGFSKGFIYMIFSLMAIIAGIFGAGKIVPLILPHIVSQKNSQVGYIILFIIIFTIIYFIIRKLSYLFIDMMEFLELEWLDSLLGGVLGLFQLIIITGVLITLANSTGIIKNIPDYQNIKYAFLISDFSKNIIQFVLGTLKNNGLKT